MGVLFMEFEVVIREGRYCCQMGERNPLGKICECIHGLEISGCNNTVERSGFFSATHKRFSVICGFRERSAS